MADVEMDLDPSRSMAHEDHVDEDLIEYDLDADAMEGENNEWTAEDLEIQDVDERHTDNDIDIHVHMEALPDDAPEHTVDAMDTLDVLPFPHTSVNDADMISDLGPDEPLEEDVEELHDADAVEATVAQDTTVDQEDSVQDDMQSDHREITRNEHTEEVEIDFSTAPDVAPIEEPAAAGLDGTSQEFGQASEIEGLESQRRADLASNAALAEKQAPESAEEEELTWEEDEAGESDEQVETATNENHVKEGEKETEHLASLDNAERKSWKDAQEDEIDNAQSSTEAQDAAIIPEYPKEKNDVTHDEQPESTGESEAPSHASEGGVSFPSITVQYKGEEFPCFAAADGFFTTTSVLEESMERLLAGFRAELVAELAPDEELVFHIDELGLEFAESTQHDILAGTTLQYVLEIYEMLVQNQDHDHDSESKNLYTYLFTRSSTSKRLEFLAESAANGKGLDEVIHLFEPAMTNHHIDGSTEHTPGILDDQGDDYPSPGDEVPEGEGVPHEDGDVTQQLEQPVSFEDVPEDAITDSATDKSQAVGIIDFAENRVPQPDVNEQAMVPGEREFGKASPLPISLETSNGVSEHENIYEQKEYRANETEPPVAGIDDTAGLESDAQLAAVPEPAPSTSSTVDGNELRPPSPTDEGVGSDNEHITTQATLENDSADDLVEIDWREEGDEDADAVPDDGQTTPAKRARVEDELGSDDENDAKRQRSS